MTDTTSLLTQLRALAQLTHTEIMVARNRIPQATSESVRLELERNARNAQERSEMLQNSIRDLGGVPDAVAPVVGRVGAFLKTTLDQPRPLAEALLDDLSLEHQLLDRARYLKVLAETAKQTEVRRLAERLITAHSATVEWLTTVLAEHALGGPAALRPTPLQRVSNGYTRAANLPARLAAGQLNRALDRISRTGSRVKDKAAAAADKASTVTNATREALGVGGSAAMRRAETIARREDNTKAADRVHKVRSETGALTAAELPVAEYDTLNAQEAVRELRALTDPADVRAVLSYEQRHADRATVTNAAQAHLTELAKQAAGIS
jgi:hypothetical protein